MKTYEELQKEWNESTYGNEFAYYVYSIDKETIERLEKEKEELKEALKYAHNKAYILHKNKGAVSKHFARDAEKLFNAMEKAISNPDN